MLVCLDLRIEGFTSLELRIIGHSNQNNILPTLEEIVSFHLHGKYVNQQGQLLTLAPCASMAVLMEQKGRIWLVCNPYEESSLENTGP